MSSTIRQSNLFAAEDWRTIYNTFRSADFQSYDYETLRKSMVDYLRTYYPEDFNDYIESSEFIALLDLISFMGQSISYRSDLNFRENFLQTAERRDSVYRMADMLGYSPNRSNNASGSLKVASVSTTENIIDSNGVNLANRIVNWNDPTNPDWMEQFMSIINSALKNNQRVGAPSGSVTIGNVRFDHYEIGIPSGRVPIYNFSTSVENRSMKFEFHSVGINETEGVYEESPQIRDSFGFLFKTDGEGNSSPNTGFFFNFKQGSLTNLDFSVGESLPNRLVSLNIDNINNNDVWLFEMSDAGGYIDQWNKVDKLRDSNIIYNDINSETRKLFSTISRANDQVDLLFGDGVFNDIPVGLFRATVRTSNGLSYTISPQEMRNVSVDIDYVSKTGKPERLKVILNLEYTVNNASTREKLSDIKVKAPQSYYSQNRMINGEDYNSFPFTKYNDIIKIKSVNRTSSGISRYLDINDFTGKYSSTNIFCEDGYLYKEEDVDRAQFVWTNASDVQNFVVNTLSTVLTSKELINLYYYNYSTVVPSSTYWIKGSADSNSSSGFFVINPDQTPYQVQPVGEFTSDNRKFIEPGSLLLFRAPDGFYFDLDRELSQGVPTVTGQVTELWASVKSVVNDGTNNGEGWLNGENGPGPVVLTENIPSNAELVEIYPTYNSSLGINLTQELTRKIINNEDFGLRYDIETRSWKIVHPLDVKANSTFSLSNAGNTNRQGEDASWIVLMSNTGPGKYSVNQRRLNFFWGSVDETRFYFDNEARVYDSRNSTVIKDQIRILEGNTLPDSLELFENQKSLEIYDNLKYSDGYRDDSRIKVTYADRDVDGVPDDPRVFRDVVNESVNLLDKLVFFEKFLDYDNFERFRYKSNETVVTRYDNLEEIELNGRFAYPVGTVYYAYEENQFYQLILSSGQRTIISSENYIARIGRQNLKFQYRHNSPEDKRVDPTSSNLIDMYILTEAYNKQFRNWLKDTTGSIIKPELPTVTEMELNYRELQNSKSISDTLLFNPAEFKILFGSQADEEFQATIKIVKSANNRISDSEIKSQVINIIDEYFSIDNWNFGETFYFSELASYIHQELSQFISSVIVVPRSNLRQFGDLYQITCEPNEIFVSDAGVADVEIIDSITASQISSNPETKIFGGYTPTALNNI